MRKRKNDTNQLINDGISTEEFKRLFRLTPEKFNLLLQLLNSRNVNKTSPKGRKPVADTTQLGLSLFFFGHLVDYVAAANFFGVAPSTAFKIVQKFVKTLLLFKDVYLSMPSTDALSNLRNKMSAFTEFLSAKFLANKAPFPSILYINN